MHIPKDSILLALEKDKKKPLKRCSACSIGMRCVKYKQEEEDVEVLVGQEGRTGQREQGWGADSGSENEGSHYAGSESFSPFARRTRRGAPLNIQAPLHQGVGVKGVVTYQGAVFYVRFTSLENVSQDL